MEEKSWYTLSVTFKDGSNETTYLHIPSVSFLYEYIADKYNKRSVKYTRVVIIKDQEKYIVCGTKIKSDLELSLLDILIYEE